MDQRSNNLRITWRTAHVCRSVCGRADAVARRLVRFIESQLLAEHCGTDECNYIKMTPERKSAWILAIIAAIEGGWLSINFQVNGWRFLRYLGFAQGAASNPSGWAAKNTA